MIQLSSVLVSMLERYATGDPVPHNILADAWVDMGGNETTEKWLRNVEFRIVDYSNYMKGNIPETHLWSNPYELSLPKSYWAQEKGRKGRTHPITTNGIFWWGFGKLFHKSELEVYQSIAEHVKDRLTTQVQTDAERSYYEVY